MTSQRHVLVWKPLFASFGATAFADLGKALSLAGTSVESTPLQFLIWLPDRRMQLHP